MSSASGAATDDTNYELMMSIGGSGGAAGAGGAVTIANPGHVETSGVGAFGIFAQSVGGGGGRGGASGDGFTGEGTPPAALSFGVSLGGGGGATGNGGDISVHLCATGANGDVYDPRKHTAAHRKLPFGTVVRVTRRDTGAVTYVTINDRGPFGSNQRIIDLSRAAAEDLAMMKAGVVDVLVEVLDKAN